jgi:hypothetical protein
MTQDPLGDTIIEELGRCTLPIRPLDASSPAGTAFLYNELIESGPDGDRVREWLVTAEHLSRGKVTEIRLRPDMIEPPDTASDYLALQDSAEFWHRRSGAAAMSSLVLHDHAQRKGWRWRTQEVTEGWAARVEDVRAIGAEPRNAWALGHLSVEPPTEEKRPLAISRSQIARDPDRVIRWRGELPEGFTGAPVFTADHDGGREFRLRCVGLIADDHRNPTVVTFDVIRALISNEVRGPRRWWGRR